ncbi:hypothetical protein ACFSKM_09205 [Ancylobacter dichloromethanicus]
MGFAAASDRPDAFNRIGGRLPEGGLFARTDEAAAVGTAISMADPASSTVRAEATLRASGNWAEGATLATAALPMTSGATFASSRAASDCSITAPPPTTTMKTASRPSRCQVMTSFEALRLRRASVSPAGRAELPKLRRRAAWAASAVGPPVGAVLELGFDPAARPVRTSPMSPRAAMRLRTSPRERGEEAPAGRALRCVAAAEGAAGDAPSWAAPSSGWPPDFSCSSVLRMDRKSETSDEESPVPRGSCDDVGMARRLYATGKKAEEAAGIGRKCDSFGMAPIPKVSPDTGGKVVGAALTTSHGFFQSVRAGTRGLPTEFRNRLRMRRLTTYRHLPS